MTLQGSCLCGALRYEITGPFTAMFHCHCSRCRKFQGAPFATFAMTAIDNLHWLAGEQDVASHAAAPGNARHFCRHCGSPAPGTIPAMGIAYVAVGTLDGDPGLRPQAHVFVGSKAPWHRISDELPQHEHFPPELGPLQGIPDPPIEPPRAGCTTGSCLCGEVAYEFERPVAMFQCHCSRCRKSRGSAHGANLFCKLDDFKWTRGEAQVVEFALPGARFFGVAFCRQCGASVPRISVARGMVVIPAGGLDSDAGLLPAAHIFVESRSPWFEITDDLPQHPEAPPFLSPPR